MRHDLTVGIERSAELLVQSQLAVAFTGAGISTPSGIPDFRSPGTGLWSRGDIPRSGSIHGFVADPQTFYEWLRPLVQKILSTEPNPAHYALADLEARGYLQTVITQNADMLHQRAGTQHVLEVHGTLEKATCVHCYEVVPARELLDQFLIDSQVPRCKQCGGVMKPNIILVGEQLPARIMLAARKAARDCDVMIVAGTSLPGGPASRLPEIANQSGARLIIVNRTPTLLDPVAEVVLHTDVAIALPALVQAVDQLL